MRTQRRGHTNRQTLCPAPAYRLLSPRDKREDSNNDSVSGRYGKRRPLVTTANPRTYGSAVSKCVVCTRSTTERLFEAHESYDESVLRAEKRQGDHCKSTLLYVNGWSISVSPRKGNGPPVSLRL